MNKIVLFGILIMVLFLVGCSRSSCREGWAKFEYAGQVNNVEDAKNIYLTVIEQTAGPNINITIVERSSTTSGGEIVEGYWMTEPSYGGKMLGKDGYWYIFMMC